MNIRKAISSDSLVLSSLCVDVQSLHARLHPEIFIMPQSDDFAQSFFVDMLADPSITIFIAEADGQATGYVVCKLIERPKNAFTFDLRYLLIDQISVRPAVQGRGVGEALLRRAEQFAHDLGVQRIQLDSWGFNLGAHEFFEKMGFEKFNHRFWKRL